MLLKNQHITEEIKKETKCAEKQRRMKTQPKPVGFHKSSAERQAHGDASLLQETRETPNKQPKLCT